MQHRHMDTHHTYKYTIRWLTGGETHTRTCKNKQQNPTCTDRDTKKKVDYTS